MQYGVKQDWKRRWTLLFVGVGCTCPLWAGVDVVVLDQNQQPVPNAVVDLNIRQFQKGEPLALQVEQKKQIDQIDHKFVPFISLIAQE